MIVLGIVHLPSREGSSRRNATVTSKEISWASPYTVNENHRRSYNENRNSRGGVVGRVGGLDRQNTVDRTWIARIEGSDKICGRMKGCKSECCSLSWHGHGLDGNYPVARS